MEDISNILTQCNVPPSMASRIISKDIETDDIEENAVKLLGIDPRNMYHRDDAISTPIGALIQEAEQVNELHRGEETTSNSYARHFLSFHFALRDMQIANTTPALLGCFTNMTAIGFLGTNRATAPREGQSPLIIDPYTWGNMSEHVKSQALVVAGYGNQFPIATDSLTSVQSDMLFTYLQRQQVEHVIPDIANEVARSLTNGGRAIFLESKEFSRHTKQKLVAAGLTIQEEDANGNYFQIYRYKKYGPALNALTKLVGTGSHRGFLVDDIGRNAFQEVESRAELIVADKP